MKKYKANNLGAFISPFEIMSKGAKSGSLKGKKFALKDLYDVKGFITGCGSPLWAKTHRPAVKNSEALDLLLEFGATLMGKTHTDEFAYSLLGINSHYGTPLNPCSPNRIPGGSSSGSASAAAAKVVDFSIGTDTGGSVRLPASFCGLFGMRPSHNRISLKGVMPLAPSFDTVGWFARDEETLKKVGHVLLRSSEEKKLEAETKVKKKFQILVIKDAFELSSNKASRNLRPIVDKISYIFGESKEITLKPHSLEEWMQVFRTLQSREAWDSHSKWLKKYGVPTDWGVGSRFKMGSDVTDSDYKKNCILRKKIATFLFNLLGDNSVFIMPTTPDIAPLKQSTRDYFSDFRDQALSILCLAGLAGLPQITLPISELDSAPLGLSIIGSPGQDEFLLQVARKIIRELNISPLR